MADKGHRSGFVALVGEPNVGKSTLLNAFLKLELCAVSPKPQTTRHKILGILNGKGFQVCFLDTPGWLAKAQDKLQGSLIRSARRAAREDADLILLLVEPRPPEPELLARAARLADQGKPILLVVNKTDLEPDRTKLKTVTAAYVKALPDAGAHRISALRGTGVKPLLTALVRRLPECPAYYGKDQASDRWERFFAAEHIRGAIFSLYRAEIPHACAVVIDQFKESPGSKDRISATIYVERPTQKGILLGRKGKAMRALRERGQAAIERFLGRKVRLELWIKVRPNWRQDPRAVREFGY